jgi:hypothetical protein
MSLPELAESTSVRIVYQTARDGTTRNRFGSQFTADLVGGLVSTAAHSFAALTAVAAISNFGSRNRNLGEGFPLV